MALVVCEECYKRKPLRGRVRRYVKAVEPVGYPDTSTICGRGDCQNPGLVWLDEEDWKGYQQGNHFIAIPNYALKVRVR